MAKIEDLIAQIPDERLRKGIASEVKVLKKTKKFGLVFEEHLPETVRLPKLSVKPGDLVALKRESGNQLWRVRTIKRNIAICDRAVEGYPDPQNVNVEFPVSDLVVVRNFGDPIYPALVPVDRVERGGPDRPWHVLINADNFHALQLLLYCYEGKVDVIYIDPPYNTGARDWKYNNDYVDKNDAFRHSKWLSMMKKRLLLAKRLLKPDGVLIVTIDEHEVQHLGVLLEQLLPEYSRQMVTIVINEKGVAKVSCHASRNTHIFVSVLGLRFPLNLMICYHPIGKIVRVLNCHVGSGCFEEGLTHAVRIESSFSSRCMLILQCPKLSILESPYHLIRTRSLKKKMKKGLPGHSEQMDLLGIGVSALEHCVSI